MPRVTASFVTPMVVPPPGAGAGAGPGAGTGPPPLRLPPAVPGAGGPEVAVDPGAGVIVPAGPDGPVATVRSSARAGVAVAAAGRAAAVAGDGAGAAGTAVPAAAGTPAGSAGAPAPSAVDGDPAGAVAPVTAVAGNRAVRAPGRQ